MHKLSNSYVLGMYLFTVLISVCIYLFSSSQSYDLLDNIYYSYSLSAISLFYFFIILTFALLKRQYFWFFLPVAILTVPNAINDFFPSFYLGPYYDRGAATGSIFTHIDIILIFSYFRFKKIHKNSTFHNKNLLLIGLLIFINFFISISYNYFLYEILPLHVIGYCFQLRYLFLFYLINQIIDGNDLRYLYRGIITAIFLVLIEASAYSFIYNISDFTSGNFGTNTFSFLLIGISFITYFHWSSRNRFLYLMFSILLILASFLTNTRMAILGLFVVIFFWINKKLLRSMKNNFLIQSSYYLFLFFVVLISIYSVEKNFSNEILVIYDAFNFVLYTGYESVLNSGLVDPNNSSLFTRFALWIVTISMILKYPFGIGTGYWNFIKNEHGLNMQIFLDPHNDYLYLIAQYGWIVGTFFIFIFFIKSFVYLSKQYKEIEQLKGPLSFCIFIIAVGLTNTNLNKHQFFAFSILILFTIPIMICNKFKRIKNTY